MAVYQRKAERQQARVNWVKFCGREDDGPTDIGEPESTEVDEENLIHTLPVLHTDERIAVPFGSENGLPRERTPEKLMVEDSGNTVGELIVKTAESDLIDE
ncbi:hypothetical protein RvY_16192 [Ramazzottius varieornatus]|uniref:Uncharacterized protein n=1 Tax=Ramazzottius varieornatus TaxID=947166 RepID=A0A1D1VXK7_RAMVA|nr:hypothetical protein RvY_16192 [Ramazzottius varieornatus]